MNRTTAPLRVESRLAWFLLWMGAVLFLGALIWGFLNPHVGMMTEQTSNIVNATSDGSQATQTGLDRVGTAWSLWSLWFGLGLMYAGYRQAINESKRSPR